MTRAPPEVQGPSLGGDAPTPRCLTGGSPVMQASQPCASGVGWGAAGPVPADNLGGDTPLPESQGMQSPVGMGAARAAAPSSPLAAHSPAGTGGVSLARPPRPVLGCTPGASSSAPLAATAHGYAWTQMYKTEPVGAPIPQQAWSGRTLTGEVIFEEGDSVGPVSKRSSYDYFLAMLPMEQLVRMVRLTSSKLEERRQPPTTTRELLKFIGVLVLATRYDFGARADLWATQARSSVLVAPEFGQSTGTPRSRFDAISSCLAFSQQDEDAGAASEKHRWGLIDDFVASINAHRAAYVTRSELICVDKSMRSGMGRGALDLCGIADVFRH